MKDQTEGCVVLKGSKFHGQHLQRMRIVLNNTHYGICICPSSGCTKMKFEKFNGYSAQLEYKNGLFKVHTARFSTIFPA